MQTISIFCHLFHHHNITYDIYSILFQIRKDNNSRRHNQDKKHILTFY